MLTTQGKNPLEKCKVDGKQVTKSYDKDMKGYIFTMGQTSKISMPSDENKLGLGLTQQFVVFQIYLSVGQHLHIELAITDSQGLKRRIIFHDGAKEIVTNPLHARVPVNPFFRNVWLNLSIDLFAFNSFCFKGVTMRSLDQIILAGPCKFRRIYTMLNPLMDSELDTNPELEACLA